MPPESPGPTIPPAADPDHKPWPGPQLKRVVQAMPWAVLALNRQGVLTQANPFAERLLGAAAGTLLGRPVAQALPPAFRPRCARPCTGPPRPPNR